MRTTAVLDINPIAPGHTMILPKTCGKHFGFDDAEVEPLLLR